MTWVTANKDALEVAIQASRTSIEEIARKSGMDKKTLWRIRNGERTGVAKLSRLAQTLNSDLVSLSASSDHDQQQVQVYPVKTFGSVNSTTHTDRLDLAHFDAERIRELAIEANEIEWHLGVSKVDDDLADALKQVYETVWTISGNTRAQSFMQQIEVARNTSILESQLDHLAELGVGLLGATCSYWTYEYTEYVDMDEKLVTSNSSCSAVEKQCLILVAAPKSIRYAKAIFQSRYKTFAAVQNFVTNVLGNDLIPF